MKQTLLLFIAAIMISGCSKYAQIYYTTNGIPIGDKMDLIHENDTLKITYSFWGRNGIMSFEVTNKLDVPIYIDWKKSSFIFNNEKLNYYEERSRQVTSGTSVAYYSSRSLGVAGHTNISVKTKEERVSFIPPGAHMFYRSSYRILENKDRYIHPKEAGKTYPIITDIDPEYADYFRNFITYSLSENGNNPAYIDDQFFISRVLSIKERDFRKTKKDSDKWVRYYPYKAGNTFYIRGLDRYKLFNRAYSNSGIMKEE